MRGLGFSVTIRVFGIAALAGGALLAAAPPSLAQSQTQSIATFVILSGEAPTGEQTARRFAPLWRQTAVGMEAARLEEPTATRAGGLPAGTPMFAVRSSRGWAYCAAPPVRAEKTEWWRAKAFTCFEDQDGDAAFDHAAVADKPFMDSPLTIYLDREVEPLPRPVRYARVPRQDGPTMGFGVNWGRHPDQPGPDGAPAAHLVFQSVFLRGDDVETIRGAGSNTQLLLSPGQTAQVKFNGALITVLGFTPGGELRYRVDKALPTQVMTLEATHPSLPPPLTRIHAR